MNISNIIILAAGLGIRMKDYTKNTPKPLIKVGKETLIEKIIQKLQTYGFKRVVINVFYLKKKIIKNLNNKFKIKILFSDEKVLLNTGGGIKNALKILNAKEFFVLNSDIVWSDSNLNPFDQLKKFWDTNNMDALLLLYPVNKLKHPKSGDFNLTKSNRIINETKNLPYIFTGIQILKSEIFLDIKRKIFPLSVIYKKLIKKERIFGIVYNGKWFHIGTIESLKEYKKMLL